MRSPHIPVRHDWKCTMIGRVQPANTCGLSRCRYQQYGLFALRMTSGSLFASHAWRRTSFAARARVSAEEDTTAIRYWAKGAGYEVSARGRIAETVKDAYHA